MYRLRLKYKKKPEVKFVSHLELIKALERTLRRTSLGFILTQGFNPRIKISFGPPTSVGMASDAEYLDLYLKESISPEQVINELNKVSPLGIEIMEAKYISLDSPSLMSIIYTASYQVVLETEPSLEADKIKKMVEKFLGAKEFVIKRPSRSASPPQTKEKKVDPRKAVFGLSANLEKGNLTLKVNLVLGTENSLRINELLENLFKNLGYEIDYEVLELKRTGLYKKVHNKLLSPLDAS